MKTLSFLLLHGAWHGGWCWRDTARFLRSCGHSVVAPTLTGLGERAHLLSPSVGTETFVRDVTAVIDAEELMHVSLVGHSFGAVVAQSVAARRPENIEHLIFLDGLRVEDGKTPFDSLPPEVVESRLELARSSSGGLTIPAPTPQQLGVSGADEQAWLLRQMTPHPLRGFTDRTNMGGVLESRLRKTYIQCVNPIHPTLGTVVQQTKADPSWRFLELDTGHDAMVSAPGITALALIDACLR